MPPTRRLQRSHSSSLMPATMGLVGALAIGGLAWYFLVYRSPAGDSAATEREAHAKKLFDHAVFFSEKHPDKFRDNLRRFQKVIEEGPGTTHADRSAEKVKEWESRWEAAAQVKFDKFREYVQSSLDRGDYDRAAALWQKFPLSYRSETVEQKIKEEVERIKGLKTRFAESLEERAEPLLTKSPEDLTREDARALSALRRRAMAPPDNLGVKERQALSVLADKIDAILAERDSRIVAKRASETDAFWEKLKAVVQAKEFKIGRTLTGQYGEALGKKTSEQIISDLEKLEEAFAKAAGQPSESALDVRGRVVYNLFFGGAASLKEAFENAGTLGEDMVFYQCRVAPILVISSAPSGAKVLLELLKDGSWAVIEQERLQTPVNGEVPEKGTYRVTVSKPGYESAARQIEVKSNGESCVHFTLEKQSGDGL